jgi:hypothetical protein
MFGGAHDSNDVNGRSGCAAQNGRVPGNDQHRWS